jgi:hypothetical protein
MLWLDAFNAYLDATGRHFHLIRFTNIHTTKGEIVSMRHTMFFLTFFIAVLCTPITTAAIAKRFVFQEQTGDTVTQYEIRVRAAFWKAEYWYRPSDGVMLRYKSVRGGPGTPKTIITLLKEENIPTVQ